MTGEMDEMVGLFDGKSQGFHKWRFPQSWCLKFGWFESWFTSWNMFFLMVGLFHGTSDGYNGWVPPKGWFISWKIPARNG